MTWVQTYSGLAVDLLDPQEHQINAIDIAHALSLQCRFNGHCRAFYSVAEHCCRVADIVEPDIRLEALLHDAAEAYIGDMVAPLKAMIPRFREIEARLAGTIFATFSAYEPPAEVRHADLVLLATEKRDLMAREPREWIELPEPLPGRIEPWPSGYAQSEYMWRLKGEHERRIRPVSRGQATAR